MIMQKLSNDDIPVRFDVCGIGNAIVDILVDSDDAFLEEQKIIKNSMNLIDENRAEELYKNMNNAVTASGGSVANAVAAIASLGGNPCYIGKVKNDDLGAVFSNDMEKLGVHIPTELSKEGPSTARCMIFVTDDAARSMCTYLGACVGLGVEDIDPNQVVNSKIIFLEGYLFDPPKAKEAFRYSAKIAHEAGRFVALSLSDLFCVDRHRDDFMSFIKDDVDILIGNSDELKSLFQVESFDKAMSMASELVEIVAGTCGKDGVVVANGDDISSVEAEKIDKLVDTTGAGDMFAGGFLYGLTHSCSLSESARIGAVSASEVLGQFGPRPKSNLKEIIKLKGM